MVTQAQTEHCNLYLRRIPVRFSQSLYSIHNKLPIVTQPIKLMFIIVKVCWLSMVNFLLFELSRTPLNFVANQTDDYILFISKESVIFRVKVNKKYFVTVPVRFSAAVHSTLPSRVRGSHLLRRCTPCSGVAWQWSVSTQENLESRVLSALLGLVPT